jgi:hypothetical protein
MAALTELKCWDDALEIFEETSRDRPSLPPYENRDIMDYNGLGNKKWV